MSGRRICGGPRMRSTGNFGKIRIMKKTPLLLAAGLLVSAAVGAAEKPWLVVNEDNDHYFLLSSNLMNRAALERYVDGIAQGHVTHFFMCVNGQRTSYASKTWEPIWEGLEDPARKDSATRPDGTHDRWAVHAKMLFDAGIDPYEVWTRRCREKGVSPWISMRMNDTHFATVSNYFRSARFVRNRRDLWRRPDGDPSKWGTAGLDYAQHEAWDYAMRQFREILERWDSDGVELDWMRGYAQNLRPRHEREDAHFITDFMRVARIEADKAAKRRGHPVKLAVRVPRSWWTSHSLGLNVIEWAKEGLVDVVISVAGVCTDTNMPIAQWIDELGKANPNVVYLPTIDCVFAPVGDPRQRNMTIEHYRGVAEQFYEKGARGLYLFNAQYYGSIDGNRRDRAAFDIICAEGLAPETVAAKPKVRIDTYNDFPDWVWEGPENVPPLMKTFDGRPVTTVEEWEKVRAPEIRERFLSQMYGKRPAAAEKPDVRFESAEPDRVMMDGKAVRKRIRCTYRGPYGESGFTFTAFVPRQGKPAPAFLLICNRNPEKNIDPERVVKSDFWPAEEIVARGYAAISFFNGDVAKDATWDFANGVFAVYEKPYERTAESWGVLSAWAWGASRVMDWIETEPTLDAKHVAVVGHSRGGKTALLTGVMDGRFAMLCSNDSGCCGAKLNHMLMPGSEHFDVVIDQIGCWFCTNFRQYRLRDAEIDFDQHMLVALLAPRLVAIGSAVFDSWAGPEAEYFTGRFASPAWELYGKKGLVGDRFPREEHPLQEGSISYHERFGGHNLTPYDWNRYMDFADRHGWK